MHLCRGGGGGGETHHCNNGFSPQAAVLSCSYGASTMCVHLSEDYPRACVMLGSPSVRAQRPLARPTPAPPSPPHCLLPIRHQFYCLTAYLAPSRTVASQPARPHFCMPAVAAALYPAKSERSARSTTTAATRQPTQPCTYIRRRLPTRRRRRRDHMAAVAADPASCCMHWKGARRNNTVRASCEDARSKSRAQQGAHARTYVWTMERTMNGEGRLHYSSTHLIRCLYTGAPGLIRSKGRETNERKATSSLLDESR